MTDTMSGRTPANRPGEILDAAAMPPAFDVIGLGYCSDDYLAITPRITPFDHDPGMLTEFVRDGGGPVSTALVALARLGARVAYLGPLGDDPSGRFLLEQFEQAGVDTRHIDVQAGRRTPACIVLVEEGSGRRSINTYRGDLQPFSITAAAQADLRAARFLHIDGHYIEMVEQAAKQIHAAGGRVVFDANRPRPHIERFLACTDTLIAAGSFPAAATDISDLTVASRRLMQAGPSLVVTTLGADGCVCVTEQERFHVPGFPVSVVDTTGAGDAFHGGFLYGLLQHSWSLRQIARFANAVGALNCRQLGGRRGLPTLDEVRRLMAAHPWPEATHDHAVTASF
jgi:sulfofructose kinase